MFIMALSIDYIIIAYVCIIYVPITTLTHYHKLSGFIQHKYIIGSSVALESNVGVTGLRTRYPPRSPVFWPFPASRAACVSWPLAILQVSSTGSSPLMSHFSDPVQNHLPIAGSLPFVTSVKSLLPREVTYSQVWGDRPWISLGRHSTYQKD